MAAKQNILIVLLGYLIATEYASALECYSGTSFIRGQSSPGQTEVCKKSSDQCIKASAESGTLLKFKLTGCSTVRCMASRDKCTEQNIAGNRMQICCCSTDKCNAKQKTSNAGGLLDKLLNRGGQSNNNNNRQ